MGASTVIWMSWGWLSLRPDAVIRAYVVGSRDELKPGANIGIVAAVKKEDGTFETNRINVGRDGIAP